MTKLKHLSTMQKSDRTGKNGLDHSPDTGLFSFDYSYDLCCVKPLPPMLNFTMPYKEDSDITCSFLFRKFASSFFD